MKRVLLATAAVVTLAGCGAPSQSATVTMGDRDCTIDPATLSVGDVEFTVHNTTAQRVPFVVNEDQDTNRVGEVDVDPGGTAKLKVHLDGADEYQVHCGAVSGPQVKPID